MGVIRFSAFKSGVISRCFPFGEPENLTSTVDELILEGLLQVQRYVVCYQSRHTDVFETDSGSFSSCGVTYVPRPRGKIIRVRNRWKDDDISDSDSAAREALEEDHCDVFDYEYSSLEDVKTTGFELKDLDLSRCRLRWGCYTVGPSNIGLTPPLKSTEQIEVVWDGIKRSYSDNDWISDDPELKSAVCFYVQKEIARQYDIDMEKAATALEGWRDMVGEMSHDCRENGVRADAQEEDEIGAKLCFSFVADGGDANANQAKVESLIEWFHPDVLLFGGDNNYTAGSSSTIRGNWSVYDRFIERGIVFPALGNHDLDTEDGKPQLSFFSLPGNGRYYRFRRGPVEFFCINSGFNTAGALVEPDGNTAASVQGQWLQAALADSEATWKVVYFHHPPYTNASTYSPGITDLRWPFDTWGADVVLSGHGHNYERLIVSGFPYFVVGTGGGALVSFIGSPTSDSQKRYSADYGALKVVADKQKMIFKFYNEAQSLIDVYGLTK